jgi:membrane peptidoglycan carboxypeptidase
MPAESLRKIEVSEQDNISRWAISYLMTAKDKSLPAMLEAALDRKYSASPNEGFFTGGGMHTFNNFRRRTMAASRHSRRAAGIHQPAVRAPDA